MVLLSFAVLFEVEDALERSLPDPKDLLAQHSKGYSKLCRCHYMHGMTFAGLFYY